MNTNQNDNYPINDQTSPTIVEPLNPNQNQNNYQSGIIQQDQGLSNQMQQNNNNNQINNGSNNLNLPDKEFSNRNDIEEPLNGENNIFSFKNANVRLNFIRKVYMILSVQLLATAGLIIISVFSDGYRSFVAKNSWLGIPVLIIWFISFYALICSKARARKVPLNYILLSIFTACMAFNVSLSTTVADPMNVFIGAMLTIAIVTALTIYAITTKTDVTLCGGLFFMLGMLLLGACILNLFIRNKTFEIILACFLCLMFGLYIVYDTQLIVGGRDAELDVDDYILGAMLLYMDIMNLFLEILKLLEHFNN